MTIWENNNSRLYPRANDLSNPGIDQGYSTRHETPFCGVRNIRAELVIL